MNLVDRESVKYLMEAAGINPSKDKGQNFLVDVEKAKKIVDLLKNPANSSVLEVGPGLGSLTYHLQEKCQNLTCIDIDSRVINYLEYEVSSHVKLVYQDALKIDLKGYEYIISNIPYNITSNLIEHILISGVDAKQFVLMVQKENFYHFFNTSKSEYGPLSVLIHLLGDIKKQFDVGASSFVPKPNCVSTVFTIDIKEDVNRLEAIETYKLACKLFLNRRKTILNNLGSVIGKDKALGVLNNLGLNPQTRPEEISPDLFLKINTTIKDI